MAKLIAAIKKIELGESRGIKDVISNRGNMKFTIPTTNPNV
jgi:hypothetical protein